MTAGPPLRLMVRFAVPLLLSNLLQLFYTIADSAVLGRLLGVSAFAAVGATGNLNWMVTSLVIGTNIGFGALFARRFGAGDTAGLRRAFASSIALTMFLSAAIAAAGLLWGRAALRALNTPAELLDASSLYLGFMLGGMPITFANLLSGGMLRALGDSRTPLRGMVFSTLLNIALDVALVFPFGIAGVAAATLLAQACSAAYCGYALRGVPHARISLADVRWAETRELLRVGLPLGLRNAVIELGGLGVQGYINAFGTYFVAGVAAAKRMYSLLLVAGGALETSVGVYVAQNHGAGSPERVKQGMRTGLRLMLCTAAVMTAAALLLGRGLLWLLVAGEPLEIKPVLDVGQAQLNVMALGLPFLHLLFLYRSALQGVGKTLIPALTGFLELAGRFAALWLLTPLWGLWGAYLADPLGWVLGAGLSAAGWRAFKRRGISKTNTIKNTGE